MKKFRNLKIFCMVSILAFALVFIGFHFLQAQVETKGKPKEEVYWTATIPEWIDDSGAVENMLHSFPLGHLFESNEKDWISVKKLGRRYRGTHDFYYQINFWIYGPDYLAGFRDVEGDWEEAYEGTPCAFPEGCDLPPYCLKCFLNKFHPHREYNSFRIWFGIVNFDIEGMKVGPEVNLNGNEGSYGFSIWYSSECSPDLYRHNVSGSTGLPREHGLEGVSIQRTDEDTWRIFVDYPMKVREIYCEEETGHGPKTKRVYRVPIKGIADFNFAIDWTKHIVQ